MVALESAGDGAVVPSERGMWGDDDDWCIGGASILTSSFSVSSPVVAESFELYEEGTFVDSSN